MLRTTVLVLLAACLLALPALAKDMPDVPFTHWAYDAVDELTDIGILQGYPDGAYKGQRTLTRYEFAEATVKLVSYLENYVDEKTAALESGVDAASARAIAKDEAAKAVAGIKLPTFDLTLDEVKSAAAASGAAAAKEALAGKSPGLSKAEAQALIDTAVTTLVTKDYLANLVTEFRTDLQEIGVDVDDLVYRVSAAEAALEALDARVTALEEKPDKVTGSFIWKAGSAQALYSTDWDRFSNMDARIAVDGPLGDSATGHVNFWRPDYGGDGSIWLEEAYVVVPEAKLPFDAKLGLQYYSVGKGLVFNNDYDSSEALLLSKSFGSTDLAFFYGFSNAYETEDAVQLASASFPLLGATVKPMWLIQGLGSEEAWGVSVELPELSLGGLGLALAGEYASYEEDLGGASLSSDNTAYLLTGSLSGLGDFGLDLSYATTEPGYMNYDASLTGLKLWSYYLDYSGLPWDWLLGAPAQALPGAKAYSAGLSKDFGSVSALARFARWDTTDGPIPFGSTLVLSDRADLSQLTLSTDLADGVALGLTWASLDVKDVDDYQYFGGALNVSF